MDFNDIPPILPPASLDPRTLKLPRKDYLVASRIGLRGRIRFRTHRACTADEVLSDDALIILASGRDRAWIRKEGRLRSAPVRAGFAAMASLTESHVVMQSVLAATGRDAAPESQTPMKLVEVGDRYEFEKAPGFIPNMTVQVVEHGVAPRFVVVVPRGPIGKVAVLKSDAEHVDDLPEFSHAYVVIHNTGRYSFVRYRGRLHPCTRAHSCWVSTMVQVHSMQLQAMLRPRPRGAGGGSGTHGHAVQ